MSKLQKYPVPRCAVCGGPIFGKGWFCSQRCDDADLVPRFERSKAIFEANGGNEV